MYMLKGYKYSIQEFTETLEILKAPEFNETRRLNIVDSIRRNCFTWSIIEYSDMLTLLKHNGGYVYTNEIEFAIRFFKKYVSDFEYYQRNNFKTIEDKRAYINILEIMSECFVRSFNQNEKIIKMMEEVFERSLQFWSNCNKDFESKSRLILFNCLVQIATELKKKEKVEFLVSQLPILFQELKNNLEPKESKIILDLHQFHNFLNSGEINSLKAKNNMSVSITN